MDTGACFYRTTQKSGALVAARPYSDVLRADDPCDNKKHWGEESTLVCEGACHLFGIERGNPDLPACDGELAQPYFDACNDAVRDRFSDTCGECACSACYPELATSLHPIEWEAVLEIASDCLSDYCEAECAADVIR